MKRAILFCLSVLLVACGAPSEPPDSNVSESNAPESNVIGDPLHKSLDKAKAVEGINQQHKADVDKAVDEAN